jgi:hypothetical protein
MGKYSKKLIASLSLFLVFSMFITVFFLRTDVRAAVLGTKNYYLVLEKQNIKKLKDNLKENYLENVKSNFSYSGKVNAKLSGDLISSDKEMTSFADLLSKFEFNFNYDRNNQNADDRFFTALFGFGYDDKKIADIDIKSADKKTILAFPELTDKTISFDSKDSVNYTDALVDDEAFEEVFGLSREDFNDLITKYIKDIIFEEIPDENVVYTENVSFDNIKCDSIVFNIDEKVISNILKAVAKELENDKDARTVLSSLEKNISSNVDTTFDSEEDIPENDIDSEIKDMCEELNDEAENIDEMQLTYTVYLNNDGILSRQLVNKSNNLGINLSDYKNLDGMDIFKLSFKEDEDFSFEIRNESKVQDNNICEGNFNLDMSGKSLVEAKYTYEKDAKVGNLSAFIGEIKGKINLEQFNNSEIIEYSPVYNNIYFNLTNKRVDEGTLSGTAAITSKIDGKRLGLTIFTKLDQSNVTSISKPQISADSSIKTTDYEKLSELYEEISTNLQNRLEKVIPDFE